MLPARARVPTRTVLSAGKGPSPGPSARSVPVCATHAVLRFRLPLVTELILGHPRSGSTVLASTPRSDHPVGCRSRHASPRPVHDWFLIRRAAWSIPRLWGLRRSPWSNRVLGSKRGVGVRTVPGTGCVARPSPSRYSGAVRRRVRHAVRDRVRSYAGGDAATDALDVLVSGGPEARDLRSRASRPSGRRHLRSEAQEPTLNPPGFREWVPQKSVLTKSRAGPIARRQ